MNLLLNKTWCEIIIPILWNNPWKYLNDDNNTNEKILLDKIISHLSDESRNNIKKLGIDLPTNLYKKPLFNYISFCRHLNLNAIKRIIINSRKKIILKEIIHLFINENTKFTHLYIPQQFNHQIHLIPGAEICFSEIEFLSCNTSINDNVLIELNGNYHKLAWDCLENVSLPFLQILKTIYVSTKPLTSLIENTNGYLNEIIINDIPHDDIDNKRIIQVIYKKCPKLKYLKLEFKNSNILELNNLLINCHYLNGLFFINSKFDWNNLFEILIKSSPINLFKFKFDTIYDNIEKDSLKYFFNNWKGKHPLLLQFNQKNLEQYSDLIEKYKEEGIIKKFDYNLCNEDFKWI
ncbi:14629_t:CDS:2 [Rhizophagus irregularis]|nr:14629_t:CDS:2 [Rhizophagus irregularis]